MIESEKLEVKQYLETLDAEALRELALRIYEYNYDCDTITFMSLSDAAEGGINPGFYCSHTGDPFLKEEE